MAKISTFTPSERTFRRIKNNPSNALSSSLYAFAEKEKKSMEEILGVPIYIFGTRIDGYVEHNGFIYAFSHVIPQNPIRMCIYVYVKNGEPFLSRKTKEEGSAKIGVCVAKIKLLQTENDNKTTMTLFAGKDINA